jgi:uncharacterized protein (DUF4415 family)
MKKQLPYSILAELNALKNMKDEDIDLSDIPELTDEDWVGGVRGKFYRPTKQKLTVRIDADLIARLKSGGPGYNKRLNDILRAALATPQTKSPV